MQPVQHRKQLFRPVIDERVLQRIAFGVSRPVIDEDVDRAMIFAVGHAERACAERCSGHVRSAAPGCGLTRRQIATPSIGARMGRRLKECMCGHLWFMNVFNATPSSPRPCCMANSASSSRDATPVLSKTLVK